MREERLTHTGVLLFTDRPQRLFPLAQLRLVRFVGEQIADERTLDGPPLGAAGRAPTDRGVDVPAPHLARGAAQCPHAPGLRQSGRHPGPPLSRPLCPVEPWRAFWWSEGGRPAARGASGAAT